MNRPMETAHYIADMILELRNLAKGENMATLQCLLEISYYEAYGIAHAVAIPDGEEKRLDDMSAHARHFKAA
jgi:hypothetical protein